MKRGKQTCRILKEIRRQIAEANDIAFVTSECQYQGDCLGTCPKCEAEVRYLEQQLERKRMAGKAIALLGLSAGVITMNGQVADKAPIRQELFPDQEALTIIKENRIDEHMADSIVNLNNPTIEKIDSIIVQGHVVDEYHMPMIGATIREKGTEIGTITDTTGYFKLKTSGKQPLEIAYIGMKTEEVEVNRENATNLQIILHDNDEELLGEMGVVNLDYPNHPRFNTSFIKENRQELPKTLPHKASRTERSKSVTTPKGVIKEETLQEDMIFGEVSTQPEFPGGHIALMSFIQENLKNPDPQSGITGRVIIQFEVLKDGSIANVKVVRGLNPTFDKAALKVIRKMPKWNPGTQRGKAVKVKFTVPITFK